MQSKAKILRELIHAPGLLAMPGVFDGYSARLVTQAGFKAAFITGAGISEAALGWADFGVMQFEDNLRACRALVGCCGVPLLADADTGYGNALNVYFTVKAFERAGVAGIMLEDQVWPKRCGHLAGKAVISPEEAADKIRAAAEAREDPDFVIKARTDALATDGLDEAIRRLNLYAEAGADLLFADALPSLSDIQTVVRNVPKPLAVNMGFGLRKRATTPLLSPRQLEELGVSVAIYPRMLTAAALQGMKHALAAFRDSLDAASPVERPDLLVSFEELNDLMGLQELRRIERTFVA